MTDRPPPVGLCRHLLAVSISAALTVPVLGASGPAAAGDPATSIAEAEALLRQGRPAAAAEAIRASGADRIDPQASYLLGFALLQVYRFEEAEAALERAVALRPDRAPWLHALAKARLEQSENLAAIEALGRAIALADDPRYLFARAMCARNVGDLDLAEVSLRSALRLDPDHAEARYQLARLSVERGEYAAAVPELARALELEPDHLEARYQLGLAELRSGRPLRAVAELERVVGAVPTHAGALYNLGRALLQAGMPEEGRSRLEAFQATADLRHEIDLLRRAVKRHPERLPSRLTLIDRLLATGRAEDAMQELQVARAQAPDGPEVYLRLAEALRQLGQTEQARQAAAFAERLRRSDP